jgi:hypothetical protein
MASNEYPYNLFISPQVGHVGGTDFLTIAPDSDSDDEYPYENAHNKTQHQPAMDTDEQAPKDTPTAEYPEYPRQPENSTSDAEWEQILTHWVTKLGSVLTKYTESLEKHWVGYFWRHFLEVAENGYVPQIYCIDTIIERYKSFHPLPFTSQEDYISLIFVMDDILEYRYRVILKNEICSLIYVVERKQVAFDEFCEVATANTIASVDKINVPEAFHMILRVIERWYGQTYSQASDEIQLNHPRSIGYDHFNEEYKRSYSIMHYINVNVSHIYGMKHGIRIPDEDIRLPEYK